MKLTKREKEILELIVIEELSSSEIALILNISIGTVNTHRKKLLQKFGVTNSVGLTKKAIVTGIIKV